MTFRRIENDERPRYVNIQNLQTKDCRVYAVVGTINSPDRGFELQLQRPGSTGVARLCHAPECKGVIAITGGERIKYIWRDTPERYPAPQLRACGKADT